MTDLFQDPRPIKAISLWQPWASLIAAGVKRHETRHWRTSYRGPIAIHAAKTLDVAGAPHDLCAAVFGKLWASLLPIGMVVAVGELKRCTPTEDVRHRTTRADQASGDFTAGRFAWTIDSVRRLDQPIPTLGRQGLFNWTPPEDLGVNLSHVLNHAEAARMAGYA